MGSTGNCSSFRMARISEIVTSWFTARSAVQTASFKPPPSQFFICFGFIDISMNAADETFQLRDFFFSGLKKLQQLVALADGTGQVGERTL